MLTPPDVSPADVLGFWLGALDAHGQADAAHTKRWFAKDEAVDHEICERFAPTYTAVSAGERDSWLDSPRGRLAYVIVLDQFSRNMFRGSPRTFERDGQALKAAAQGVARGHDRDLGLDERSFLYMPFMHSEDLAMQDRAVSLFQSLLADAPGELRARRADAVKYAEKHRAIIARFGRFPHRNGVLQRTSTPEEFAFIQEPGNSF